MTQKEIIDCIRACVGCAGNDRNMFFSNEEIDEMMRFLEDVEKFSYKIDYPEQDDTHLLTPEQYSDITTKCRKDRIAGIDYFMVPDDLVYKTFAQGEMIHTIDCHCLEDGFGNDVNQDILFVNPNIITGIYKITGRSPLGGYDCVCVKNIYPCHDGMMAHVSDDFILENYAGRIPHK